MTKKLKKNSSQPLRVEDPDAILLITSKCVKGEMWFVNNKELEERIYAFVAKYCKKYKVKLYAIFIMGNHYHLVIQFPYGYMPHFMRDLNARIAEAVRMLVPEFEGGPVFQRRYTTQILADEQTIEDKFFYTWLQPVTSKICARNSEYTAKSLFNDAFQGTERDYKYFSYYEYNLAKKKDSKAKRKDFWKTHSLEFSRLPWHENLSQKEYELLMLEKLEARRLEEVAKSPDARYKTKSEIKRIRPGSKPKNTKKGGRRPLVLAASIEAKNRVISWYLSVVAQFKEACAKYRAGEFSVDFPPGTFRPPGVAINST